MSQKHLITFASVRSLLKANIGNKTQSANVFKGRSTSTANRQSLPKLVNIFVCLFIRSETWMIEAGDIQRSINDLNLSYL